MKKILLASACILAPSTAGALAQTQPAPGASSEGNVGPTTRHNVTTRHNTKRGVTTGSAAASEHQEVDQRFLCTRGCLDVSSAMTKPVGKTRQEPDREHKIHQDKDGRIGQHGRAPSDLIWINSRNDLLAERIRQWPAPRTRSGQQWLAQPSVEQT